MQVIRKNESGIAHLSLVLLLIALAGAVGLGYWRVSSSNKNQSRSVDTAETEPAETLPQDLLDIKTVEEIGQMNGATNGVSVVKFVLESKDGKYVYKMVLSNGKKLVVDAATGEVLSEETTDVSEDDKIPAGVSVTVSAAEAYKIAAAKSSSPIKTIEMEVEDKKVVYKVEFKDGSKVEIDASSGAVIKSEIKSESSSGQSSDENQEDEDEPEDEEDEDGEDSEDEEDDR